jgi:integrase
MRRRRAAVPRRPRRSAQRKPPRRIWHQASAAAISGQAGTQPVRRPYDLRHAALSLWLASGAPPAEIASRAGHSVRVLLTI